MSGSPDRNLRLTDEGRAGIARAVRAHVSDDRIPGLVALVAHGEDVHVEAAGSLSIGGRAVRRDSLFRISSTTKPLTGGVTMALAGEGLLDIDEPWTACCPSWPTGGSCSVWTAIYTRPSRPAGPSRRETC